MENAFFTYFILFLTFGWAQGRLVRVPNGPLVSVVGQRVSIRCTVSDYEGPREQDFDWTVLRGADSLQVISTFDPAYSDRSLQGRVDSGDISMERINNNTVELRIRNLKATDSAIYRCSTPSTDSVIRGNYEDEVQLKVIADSLKVSAVAPPAVVPEGGRISLHCTATVDSAEHTSLSITWFVRKGTSLEAILTFGPERAVTTGAGYRKRYADGGLRLGFPGGGAYDLVLTEALPADQGVYVCTAKQSVLEQSGVWQELLQRSVDMGEVRVTPTRDEVYGKKGGEITLSPGSLSGPLERIVWKRGDDKAIEWEGGQTEAYRQFRVSTTLNETTGEMRITKLDSTFNGVYSSDVNGIQATKRWTLTVLDPVSKPIINISCTESKCVLSCENKATVKVQCAWRKGEEELQKYDRTLELEKTDDKVGKAYICNCSNPVSFASDQIVPFPPETPVGLVVGLSCGLYILAGVITFIFREKLMESVRTCCGTRGNADEGGAKDPQDEPLNKNAAGNQDGANETSEGDTTNGPNSA